LNNLEQTSFQLQDNAEHEYWVFKNELDEFTCKKIISLGNKKWKDAEVGLDNGATTLNKKVRETDVYFANEDWLYDICWGYLHTANKNSNWNFQIDCAEALQVTRYRKNGHYDFHIDGNGFTRWNHPYNNITHNKTRKLSMTIVLNEDYEGGEFEFFNNDTLIKEKMGTIIVFPSYMLHKVRPVTKGMRYSLVAWFNGEPFK
jgi:PKHD-type hydroxylase